MPADLLMKNATAPVRRRRQQRRLYLASDQLGLECPLLPVPLTALVSRVGWTWVDPDSLLPHHRSWRKGDRVRDPGSFRCPLREPGLLGEQAGLVWIDDARYPAPGDWIADARACGPSLRIAGVPAGFVPGETWVLVAHRTAFAHAPGIVHVFQPTRLEELELPAGSALPTPGRSRAGRSPESRSYPRSRSRSGC